MEIVLTVVMTLLVVGLGLSLFLQYITVGLIQNQVDKISKVVDKQDIIMSNQSKFTTLLANMTYSINALIINTNEFMSIVENSIYSDPSMFDSSDTLPPNMMKGSGPRRNIPEWMDDFPQTDMTTPDSHKNNSPKLSEEEIKFLRNLLRKDEESEDNG